MAIELAGGTRRNDLYPALTTRPSVLSSIKTSLVAAGWTSEDIKAFSVLTVSGTINNNETVVLNGKTYTWKTVLTNTDGFVQIGGTVSESLDNLKAAINLGAGAGTAYAAATTLHPTIEGGTKTATTLVCQDKTAGISSALTSTETMTNGAFGTSTLIGGGYKLSSAITPQGLRCKFYFYDNRDTNTRIRIIAYNFLETGTSHSGGLGNGFQLFGNASFDLRIIANKYQFFIMEDGVAATSTLAWFAGGTPAVPSFLAGALVTNATNTTPIQITTATPHGLTTGQSVTIKEVLGNTAANVNSNTVTVLDANNFTLDAVAGSGTYTSGGVAGRTGFKVVEAFYCNDPVNSNSWIRGRLTCETTAHFVAINGSYATRAGGAGIGSLKLLHCSLAQSNYDAAAIQFFDGTYLSVEPLVALHANAGTQAQCIGQLWDAILVRNALTKDITGTFGGFNWWNLGDSVAGGAGEVKGSVIVIVP